MTVESTQANAPTLLVSSLEIEKANLLVEKLRLDNEEQRARIAQLQIKWWQKPIGLLAMFLPLIPLMATGAAAVGDQWSKNARMLANTEKKSALLEKQGYELENLRVGHIRAQLELENKTLLFEQTKLKDNQVQLSTRVKGLADAEQQLIDNVFSRYVAVCSIGGKIVTARGYKTARDAFTQLSAIEILAVDANINQPLLKIDELLKRWASTDIRPQDEIEQSVLQVSLACKADFRKFSGVQFAKPVEKLTSAIYGEAELMVEMLVASRDFADAQPTIDQFWELYYGKLVLVEDEAVESAMVTAGQVLKQWKQSPPDKDVLLSLRGTFQAERESLAH